MKKLCLIILFLAALILLGGFFAFKKEKPVEIKPKGGEMEVTISGKKVLLVVAPKDFRDEEYQKPRQVLENAGVTVEVASKGATEAVGMFGAKAKIDKDISQVNIDDYAGVLFVGGTGAAVYFNDQNALNLAKTAFEKRRVVGAICIAPSILANAGILAGKKATAFSSEQENLTVRGAQYTGETVTVDGKIITGRGPEAAQDFAGKLVEVLERR